MREPVFQRYLTTLRLVFTLVLVASFASFVYKTIHWQLTWDPSIMHYMNFLADHGWAPYRDIIDNNLPGSYLVEGWAMHVFGGGDLGWRLYDYFLILVLTASMVVIAIPYDWFVGVYAGGLFMLMHALDGARNAGQREQVMVTFILVAYALLFTSVRRYRPLLLLPFGFLIAFAASFKPTVAPLGLLLLGMAAFALRKRGVAIRPYLVYGLAGMLIAFLTTVVFFYEHHDFAEFVATSRRLLPYYASVGNKPFSKLIPLVFNRPRLGMLVVGVLLLLVNRARYSWENWERLVLAVGIFFGALSYLAQRKDFEHHVYTFAVFVFLWTGLEFAKAMKTRGWPHLIGLACFGYALFFLVPGYIRRVEAIDSNSFQADAIKDDLIRLGGSRLQGQVQCLDMVDGCFASLYHLGLVPNTGFMGDYMLLGPKNSSPLPYYRTIFWDDLHKNPPKVIVLTKMWLANGNSFDKLMQWPELAAYLDSAYTLETTRNFDDHGYRIYLLREPPK